MMNNAIMRRYWVLFTSLFAAFPLMKWIMLSGIAVMVLGIPIYGVWENSVGFGVGGGILFLGVFGCGMVFPSQMLSIASSKQIGGLPGLRDALFFLFLLMCLCVTIGSALLVSIKNHYFAIHEFWVILLLVSAILIGAVVLGQKYPGAQFIIFMSFWVLPRVYNYLMGFHLGILVVSSSAVWFTFYHHWKNWRPEKFHQNIFSMSQTQLIEFNRQRSVKSNPWFYKFDKFLSIKPESLIGSLLLGRADGGRSKLVSAITVLLVLLLFVGVFLVISDKQKFQGFFAVGGQTNMYILYFSMVYGLILCFFRNMHKAWLYFDGSRELYFKKIEKIFYGFALVSAAPVLLVHIGITYFMLDWGLYLDLIWVTAIYSLIAIAITFYTNLFLYQITKASLRWNGWIGILLMAMLVIPVIVCNVMWVEHKAKIIHWAYFFMAGSLLAIYILRNWVKKKWISVDFVRVKS